jgi:hypothetical protein
MAAVQWETVPQETYDDMVAVLLNTLHPDAERLDGRGGDGGRDIQLRHDGRLDLFELKSFTGRLGKEQGRRAQVERSLKRAAQLDPDSLTRTAGPWSSRSTTPRGSWRGLTGSGAATGSR